MDKGVSVRKAVVKILRDALLALLRRREVAPGEVDDAVHGERARRV